MNDENIHIGKLLKQLLEDLHTHWNYLSDYRYMLSDSHT